MNRENLGTSAYQHLSVRHCLLKAWEHADFSRYGYGPALMTLGHYKGDYMKVRATSLLY